MTFSEIVKQNTLNLDNYIVDVWGSFDAFYDDVKAGDNITLPSNCLVPRSKSEWDNASEGNSRTSGRITLSFDKINVDIEARGAELVIYDGHNRYKDLISNKRIQCVIN